MSNWCGGEWAFKFSTIRDKVKKLPFVDPDLLDSCYMTIEIRACNPHDDKFELWGGIYDFIKANYEFAIDVVRILHWTTITGRAIVFLSLFTWTTLFWRKFFNWTHIWKRK